MNYLRIIMLIIFSGVPLFLHAQDFQINHVGVRARSMAGAYIGIADDVSAAFWNPAGLAQTKRFEFYCSVLNESYCISSKIEDFDTNAWESSHWTYDFVGIKFPFFFCEKIEKLITTLSMHNKLDFFYEFENDKFSEKQKKGINAISLSFAYPIVDSLFMGLTINQYRGKRKFNFTDHSVGDYYGGNTREDSSYTGFGSNIGALYRHYPFKFGIVVKPHFKLKEGNDEDNYKAEIRMPWVVGIGIGYHFSQEHFVSLDMEWQDSKKLYRKYKNVTDPSQKRLEERIGCKNIFQVRCGSELKTNVWKFSVPIRVGVAFTPTYNRDMENRQIIGSLATLGSGIGCTCFNFDFGIEYNSYLYKIRGKGKYREHYLSFLFAFVFRFDDKQ